MGRGFYKPRLFSYLLAFGVSGKTPSETVRKAPIGSKLKPQKSTKTGRKSPIISLL
jgi:hypothetical protein